MSTKTTLLLLAIAGILFGFIVLYEKSQPKSWEAAERELYALVFDKNSVEGIDIVSNEDKVELRKRGNQWMLEAPLKDRADRNAVNEILTLCESLQKEPVEGARNAEKKQLKAFGVAKPPVRIKLLGTGEMPPALFFGKDTAVEGKVYVRLEDSNTVSVANNELRNLIVRKPDEFRDHQLADFDSTGVAKASIKTPAGEIELAKQAGHWEIVKPLKARADDAAVAAFLDSVLHTQIAAFAPENANLNSYGLSEPRGTVTFWAPGQSQPKVLEIGAREEKTGAVYARISNRGAVCLLPKEAENILGIQPNDLRDRRLLRVDLDIVDRITLRPASKPPILLQRRQEEWTLREGGQEIAEMVPANRIKILQLVKELQTRKIAAFVTDVASDLAKYGFDQPQLRVTFSSYASENTAESSVGEQPILTVSFGKTEGNIVYARVEDEPFVVSVDKSLLEEISTTQIEWRSRTIFRLKPSEIASMDVTTYTNGIPRPPVALIVKAGEWIADEGSTPGLLSRINIQSLVNTLSALKAMQWTNESGPVPPVETIAFTTVDGKTHKLVLGAVAQDGTCLTSLQSGSGVFRLAAPDVSALRLPLIEAIFAPTKAD